MIRIHPGWLAGSPKRKPDPDNGEIQIIRATCEQCRKPFYYPSSRGKVWTCGEACEIRRQRQQLRVERFETKLVELMEPLEEDSRA